MYTDIVLKASLIKHHANIQKVQQIEVSCIGIIYGHVWDFWTPLSNSHLTQYSAECSYCLSLCWNVFLCKINIKLYILVMILNINYFQHSPVIKLERNQ